jgi:hypothetical protein
MQSGDGKMGKSGPVKSRSCGMRRYQKKEGQVMVRERVQCRGGCSGCSVGAVDAVDAVQYSGDRGEYAMYGGNGLAR